MLDAGGTQRFPTPPSSERLSCDLSWASAALSAVSVERSSGNRPRISQDESLGRKTSASNNHPGNARRTRPRRALARPLGGAVALRGEQAASEQKVTLPATHATSIASGLISSASTGFPARPPPRLPPPPQSPFLSPPPFLRLSYRER